MTIDLHVSLFFPVILNISEEINKLTFQVLFDQRGSIVVPIRVLVLESNVDILVEILLKMNPLVLRLMDNCI